MSAPERPTRSRPGPARTHGSPGLTVPGVVVVGLAISLVGLLLDLFTGGGLGWLFGGFFVLGSAYTALQVRQRDLLAAVIVPPLVFAVLLLVASALTGSGGLTTRLADVAVDLVGLGPFLWAGTGLAAVIVLVRHRRARRTG
ncbi:MAG: hypothetical protein MUC45_04235 [Actinomycetia bacterium]|nr:hypothetical protein [Actinomycetes bacterium]